MPAARRPDRVARGPQAHATRDALVLYEILDRRMSRVHVGIAKVI